MSDKSTHLAEQIHIGVELTQLAQDPDVLGFCGKVLKAHKERPSVLRLASLILRLHEEIEKGE